VRLRVDELATPIGSLFIVTDDESLCVVDFDGCEDRMRILLARRFGAFELVRTRDPLGFTTRLARYFAGDLAALEGLRAETGGTPYQRAVWTALRGIPVGETRTYGQIAARIGGTHARAVGHANSLNPVAIVVPCHRVIGANSTLTGYAGGLHRKRWLLDHEGANGAVALPM
jgi:methylated-DNA-[protein]-cysteine S-methyltransferase